MPTVKELQEERAPIGVAIRQMADKINNEKRDFTAEERKAWDQANADFNRLSGSIEVARRAEEVDTELKRRDQSPPGSEDTDAKRKGKPTREDRAEATEELRALALQGWCRRQHNLSITPEQKRACKLVGLNPAQRSFDFNLRRRPNEEERAEKRDMSATIGSAGGVTVPKSFVNGLEKALKSYNGVRQVADVMRTDDGREMPWPSVNDTTNMGQRIGENTQVVKQDAKFGFVQFGAYKYTSNLILFPTELLEDSAFNLAAEIGPMLGERIARVQELEDTVGTGNAQPLGVVTASVLGKQAASGSAIAADEIIDLIHSVDTAYRNDPSFALMFHDLILSVIRKLKDSQNRYLFEEGQNGAPDRIKGCRYVINQNMDSTIASGKKTMLAGAFRKYKIRDVKKVRFRRLDERYGDYDQVGFVAFTRHDARLLDAGTNPVKHLVHP
ncbi:phage major capsid protein [bacterium]|nr:phage major capsid protein [bacterium]